MMKKYLLLLSVPFILTGCFNEEPDVVAPTEEDAAVEQPAEENEVTNDESGESQNSSEEDATDVDDQTSDNTDGDESNSVAQTSSDSTDSESSDESSSQSTSGNSSSTSGSVSESDEQEAIDAVNEHANFEQSDLIYLTHLEDNGEWLQVEVREGIEGQSQTSLIALYRRNIETGSLEVFDFLEDGYSPVDEGTQSSDNQ